MRKPVKVVPGTHPTPDSTALNTVRYVSTNNVYFNKDKALCKYPGWSELTTTISGATRTIYGFSNGTNDIILIGTHKRLYSRINGVDTNITPLETSGLTLGTDPIATDGSTAVLTITNTSHGLADGDRISLAGATGPIGGVPASEINAEHIITYVDDNSYTITVTTDSTSATSGGGASVVEKGQIAAGNISQGSLFGYGGGTYGTGNYGESKAFTSAFAYPRIWSADKYGNDVVVCPGDNGVIYSWDGDITAAPVAVTNAPTANWVSVRNNSIKARGAASTRNRLHNSDTDDTTVWTAAASNNAYVDDWEEAGRFISDAYSRDIALIFTENEVVSEEFYGPPEGYVHRTVMDTDGILGPNARIEIEDMVLWAGSKGFYLFDGAKIEKIMVSCHDYIFAISERGGNLNRSQRYKCFWEYDADNDNAVFHFPAGAASEPDEYMILHLPTRTATLGTRNLTAAEQEPLNQVRRTAYGDNTTHELYSENTGLNAGASAMSWFAESHWRQLSDGAFTQEIMEIYPDSVQTGDMILTIYTKFYAQDSNTFTFGPYTISPTTKFIAPQAEGSLVKYRWEGTALNTDFRSGAWSEEVQVGTAA